MSDLKQVLLKDIAKSLTGPFGSQLHESDYVSEGTPIVTVEHLGDTGFALDNLPYVSDADKERLSKYVLKEGDIVFSRVGSVDRSTYVTKNEEGWLFSGRCLRVRCNNSVNSRYLSFYFKQKTFKKMMVNISVGATMPSLNTELIDNIQIYLPPKGNQDEVADFLLVVNDKITLNNKINAELEQLARLIYNYWFVQFDFPISAAQAAKMGKSALEGKPYRSSGGSMVWNEELKREVPVGWEVGTFEDIAVIIGGSTPSTQDKENFSEDGTAWITPKDLAINEDKKFITRGETNVSNKGLRSASLKIMPAGTILMSSRAPIGYVAISRGPLTTNQGFKSFVPKEGYSSHFVFYKVKTHIPTFIRKSSGSTFQEISGSTLREIQIELPPNWLIDLFSKKMEPIFTKQDITELENQELIELRDFLLPLLMNGQVRVGD